MQITYMWKDTNSAQGDCPAIYQAPGGYVVQGVTLDVETRAQLRNLTDSEDAVYVPANVLDRLREIV